MRKREKLFLQYKEEHTYGSIAEAIADLENLMVCLQRGMGVYGEASRASLIHLCEIAMKNAKHIKWQPLRKKETCEWYIDISGIGLYVYQNQWKKSGGVDSQTGEYFCDYTIVRVLLEVQPEEDIGFTSLCQRLQCTPHEVQRLLNGVPGHWINRAHSQEEASVSAYVAVRLWESLTSPFPLQKEEQIKFSKTEITIHGIRIKKPDSAQRKRL